MDRFERFSFALFEISRHWHRLADEELGKVGLKGSYATYLTTLYQYEEGITSAELCKKCGKDKADTSRAVNLFEEKGIINKSDNSYRCKIVLTDKGREIAQRIKTRAATAVDYAGRDLSEKDREIFYTALESIVKNLKKLSKEGIPTE